MTENQTQYPHPIPASRPAEPEPPRKRTFAKLAIFAAAGLVLAGGGAAAGAALKPEVVRTVEVEKIVEKEVVPVECRDAVNYAQQGIELQQEIISGMNNVIQKNASDVSLITNQPAISKAGEELLGLMDPYHYAKDTCLEK